MLKQYRVCNPPDSEKGCDINAETPAEAARIFFERKPETRSILVRGGSFREWVFSPRDLAERFPEVDAILEKEFPEYLESEEDEYEEADRAEMIRELAASVLRPRPDKVKVILIGTLLVLSIPVALIYLVKWFFNIGQ